MLGRMDDRRVGEVIRLVRREKGWRQLDVAIAAGVSQSCVSDMELGYVDALGLPTMRAIAEVLEIKMSIELRWRGSELSRLLDRDHAAIVESLVRILGSTGWEILVEWSFNHYGERGSVDVVAWHPARRALLIVEVKSRIVDVQELLGTFGRKIRIVPGLLAAERGWRPVALGRVIVVRDTTAARGLVGRHEATFSTAFPQRGADVRRWLRDPTGELGAVWFLSDTAVGDGKRDPTGPPRVRKPKVAPG